MRGEGNRPCDAGVDTFISITTVGNNQYSADHDHNQDVKDDNADS